MKSDYTYIGLFTPPTAARIVKLQNKIAEHCGRSPYMDQFPPHVTLSFGNLLSDLELEEVKSHCSKIASSFSGGISFASEIIFKEKTEQGKTFTSVRMKLGSTLQFNEISRKVVEMAKKYEVPVDFFTEDHFHVGLGRYEGSIDKPLISKLIEEEGMLVISIKKLAIYYSMLNEPKPEKAIERAVFPFSQ